MPALSGQHDDLILKRIVFAAQACERLLEYLVLLALAQLCLLYTSLFRCDGIRTARFYSIFAQMRKIKVIFERRQQPCQLMFVQRGRCAAANVDALHLLARCADKRGCLLDLAARCV